MHKNNYNFYNFYVWLLKIVCEKTIDFKEKWLRAEPLYNAIYLSERIL